MVLNPLFLLHIISQIGTTYNVQYRQALPSYEVIYVIPPMFEGLYVSPMFLNGFSSYGTHFKAYCLVIDFPRVWKTELLSY